MSKVAAKTTERRRVSSAPPPAASTTPPATGATDRRDAGRKKPALFPGEMSMEEHFAAGGDGALPKPPLVVYLPPDLIHDSYVTPCLMLMAEYTAQLVKDVPGAEESDDYNDFKNAYEETLAVLRSLDTIFTSYVSFVRGQARIANEPYVPSVEKLGDLRMAVMTFASEMETVEKTVQCIMHAGEDAIFPEIMSGALKLVWHRLMDITRTLSKAGEDACLRSSAT